MEAIAQLEIEHFLLNAGIGHYQSCINWAMQRLSQDQEGDDLEIVLLAAATTFEEVRPLVKQIVERYRDAKNHDDQFSAGKYIASLRNAYIQGKETIESLDAKLSAIYNYLGNPNWLVMLSRNCEYATDMPAFEKPFEDEFAYVSGLWTSANSRAEFESLYSRAISNQHDAKYC